MPEPTSAIVEDFTKPQFYEFSYENAPDIYILIDPINSRIQHCNKTFSNLTNIKKEDILNTPLTTLFSSRTTGIVKEGLALLRRYGQFRNLTLQLKRDSKRTTPVLMSAISLCDEQGKTLYYHLILREIKEIKNEINSIKKEAANSQDTLIKNQIMTLSMIENLSDGIVAADHNGKFLVFNKPAEKILGIGATETAQDEWTSTYGLSRPDTEELFETKDLPLVRALNGEFIKNVEMLIINPHINERMHIKVSASPFYDDDKNLLGAVAILSNTTQDKKRILELEQENKRLKELLP